jgi:hypothetical protein
MLGGERPGLYFNRDDGGSRGIDLGQGLTAVEKWGESNYLRFLGSLQTFDNDLSLVGHNDRRRLPWEEPNPVGQYTLTYMPEPRNVVEGMRNLAQEFEGTTDILLTCMDKDVAQGVYKTVKGHERNSKVFTLMIGGGPVQNAERQQSLDELGFYLYKIRQYGGLPKLKRVWAVAHNHQCGAVKHFLGGTPLHEHLSSMMQVEAKKQGQEESGVMMAMTRNGVYRFEEVANLSPNLQLYVGLADTYRDGRGGVKLYQAGSGPKLSVHDLDSEMHVRNAAYYMPFK